MILEFPRARARQISEADAAPQVTLLSWRSALIIAARPLCLALCLALWVELIWGAIALFGAIVNG
jgi:hypothetical protein